MNIEEHVGYHDEWWATLFDREWARIYSYKRRDAPREARTISKMLGLPLGSKILDLCCGDGRITLALARLGYKLTGLDLSITLLEIAEKRARRSVQSTKFVRADMREIPSFREFDAVISISTSFGYFQKEDDDLRVLRSAQRALKTKGKLILDLENIHFLAHCAQLHGTEPAYQPLDGFRRWVEEVTSFDPAEQTVEIRLRTWLNGVEVMKQKTAEYRAYSFRELRTMLDRAGFAVQNVYGDFTLHPYDIHSCRMIVLCEKLD